MSRRDRAWWRACASGVATFTLLAAGWLFAPLAADDAPAASNEDIEGPRTSEPGSRSHDRGERVAAGLARDDGPPRIRRIYVPAENPQDWPQGDWQPIPLSELEKKLASARAAVRPRPRAFLERGEYSATLVDGEIRDGQLEWTVRRPDSAARFLEVEGLNFNVSHLAWTGPDSTGAPVAAVWGLRPEGSTAILVDRPAGRLLGRWSFSGRKLAGSAEFDVEIVPAVISRMTLRVKRGLILSSSAGELAGPTAMDADWNEWRLNLGSRARSRLRVAPAPLPNSARPLVVTRNHLSYVVRPEGIRVNAECQFDVLEASLRELHLTADPEMQITSIEYGEDGGVAWYAVPGAERQEIVVKFPEALTGEGHGLNVQGITPAKGSAAWPLPRVRVQNAVEASGRVTLRLQPPFQAADVRPEGYRQLELTGNEADGEVFVFRQTQTAGRIVVVPADGRADLACRAVTLIEPDRNQWALTADMEWSASAGSALMASCLLADDWEIVDVRAASGENAGGRLRWDIHLREGGGRVLQVHFLYGIKPERPQRVRVSARRSAPAGGERAAMPPLTPLDLSEIDHVLAAASPDQAPLFDSGAGIELIGPAELPPGMAGLDFLTARLSDRRLRISVVRIRDAAAAGTLRLVPPAPDRDADGQTESPPTQSPSRARKEPSAPTGPWLPAVLEVNAQIAGPDSDFDHYQATFRLAGTWHADVPFRWELAEPAQLIGVSVNGRTAACERLANGRGATLLPAEGDLRRPRGPALSVSVEYRVPARFRRGPNSRALIFPEPECPVLGTQLDLALPPDVRMSGPPRSASLRGIDERGAWQRRLLGRFSRGAGEPAFDPFRKESWAAFLSWGTTEPDAPRSERKWHGTAPGIPRDARVDLWRAGEADWLSLTALLLCLLFGLSGRAFGWQWRRSLASGCLAGLFLAALALAPVEAELAGSGLTGLVLACLAPHRLLARRPSSADREESPQGSTQSFVVAGIAILFWLAILNPGLSAQEGRPGGTEPVADVLIPVGRDDGPAGENAAAYISKEFLFRLNRLAGRDAFPRYLIGASSFNGRVLGDDRLDMTARFELHVFDRAQSVPVTLPVGTVNLAAKDSCLVDGQPQPVLIAPGGRGLTVEVPGAAAGDGVAELARVQTRGEDSGEFSDRQNAAPISVATHTVELHLLPSVNASRGDLFTATLAAPSGCRTQAALSSARDLTLLGVSAGRQGQAAGAPPHGRSSIHEAEIRPSLANQFVFYWTARAEGVAPPVVEAQVGLSSLVDLLPASLDVRCHVSYRVTAGQLGSLVWHVPAGYTLKNLQGPRLAGYQFYPAEDGGRRLQIELAVPQEGEFSLAATFVAPLPEGQSQFALALLDPIRAESGPFRKVGLRFQQLALKHAFDVRVQATSGPGSQALRPRAVDEFLKEWNPAGARPQQAFELDRLFEVNLATEQVSAAPAVRAASVGRFHPGRLDWVYTAEIEPPISPVFLYRLQVDPRLRIRSASVQEDGAERLLRPAQAGEHVVLFLNDRAARSQTIRLEATLPLAPVQELEIPRIRFAGATPGNERVALYKDANVAVQLKNPEDFPLTPGEAPGTGSNGESLVARLEVVSEQSNPRLEIGPVPARVFVETASVVALKDERLQLTACARFRVESGRRSQFVVDLPEGLARRATLRSIPDSQFEMGETVDGRIRVAFYPQTPIGTEFLVIASADESRPEGEWQVPTLRPARAELEAAYLIVASGAFEEVRGDRLSRSGAVPGWLSKAALKAVPKNSSTYIWREEPPPVVLHSVPVDSAGAIIEAARIDLWPQGDGTITGWLAFRLPDVPPRELKLTWPGEAEPIALFLGDRFRSLPHPQEGACALQLDGAEAGDLVWLAWRGVGQPLRLVSVSLAGGVPWPSDLPVTSCRVNVHPPSRYRINADDRFLALEGASPDRVAPPLAWDLVTDGRLQSASLSANVSPVPQPGRPFPLSPGLSMTSQQPIQWALSMLGAAGAFVLCWKTGPLFGWLSQRSLFAWMTVASFWWLCLEPSWLGPAAAIWIGGQALVQKLRASSPGARKSAPAPLA